MTLLLLLTTVTAIGQDTTVPAVAKLCVKSVIARGNKRTKDYVIIREVHFKAGDSLLAGNIAQELEQARRQVYNTTLFNEVKISIVMQNATDINVLVEVKERWYLFPVPQFKLVDRNFNEWLKTFNADLNRVNYGIKFVHYNFSGRRDQLRIFLLNGFNRNISFSYTSPGSNSALTEGFTVGGSYSKARQVVYNTNYNNKQQFFPISPKDTATNKPGNFVQQTWSLNAGYILRRGILNRHLFSVAFAHTRVSDSVISGAYNPGYFNNGKNKAAIIDFNYTFVHNDVNNTAYPLTGNRYMVNILKRGLGFKGGLNMLSLEGSYHRFRQLTARWYFDVALNARIRLPFDQPFINQQSLGFGENYLRGMEPFVINGLAHGLIRSTLRHKILAFTIPLPFKSKAFPKIPFTIYAKTYADAGYSYTKKKFDTYFNNRLLYSGGFGIDILTLYDVNLRLEYSFNQLGQRGFFIHNQSGF